MSRGLVRALRALLEAGGGGSGGGTGGRAHEIVLGAELVARSGFWVGGRQPLCVWG
ncbi:hypothetical protein [Limisphaera sp. VF-2]|uniref:hypothetical protein n=1 Tax=Limisphaera sp. VF-2 TaxID=3400418 RepID=UPI003C162274